ncbi:MAG: S-layer homology domain-containing protein, partial [Halanaerobiales bacterium]
MINKTTKHLSTFIFIISILLVSTSIYAKKPTDISNHWAQDYILNLVNNEVMDNYKDGEFRPDQAITRGEFAVALAKQLNLVPDNNSHFKDINGYPNYPMINSLVNKDIVSGYPDNTFRPDKALTRAEMIAIMIKSLGITDNQVTIELDNYSTFKDIPENHWGLNHIKIADKLDLINGDQNNHFNPNKTASRAEAAKVITKLASLTSETGYITDVYPSSNKVSINSLNGERTVYNFGDETLVGRNNRFVKLDDIMKTDKVFIIADSSNNNIRYAKAYGMVTEDDLATEVSTMTNGVFQPEEIKKLSYGNINILRPKVQ